MSSQSSLSSALDSESLPPPPSTLSSLSAANAEAAASANSVGDDAASPPPPPSSSAFSMRDKVVLITGGGQCVGEGVARRLASHGARVALFDVNGVNARRVAASIGVDARGTPALAVEGDVTVATDVERCVAAVAAHFGAPVDVLVNNAGIVGKAAPVLELSADDFRRVLDVNVVGPFLFTKAVLPAMLARGRGRIVNVASIAGKEGNPTLVPYSASKAAVINMTKAVSKEVLQAVAATSTTTGGGGGGGGGDNDGNGGGARADITVNCIAPAVIRTSLLDSMPQTTIDYMLSKIPMGRCCEIAEVASLVQYLASDEASFCTGQCYDISGGRATY